MVPLLLKLLMYYLYFGAAIVKSEEEIIVVEGRKMQSKTQQQNMMRIKVIGSDPLPWQLPLGRCVGDCDSDKDCEPHLICFQRTRYEAVPGCDGGERDGSYSDYCIRRSDTTTTTQPETSPPEPPPRASGFPNIKIVGNNVFEKGTYPLGHCEGDCDDDRKDCRYPLVCFQRNRNQSVFGCSGGLNDNSQQDYCIYPDNSVIPPDERPPLPYTSQPFNLKLYWEEGYKWQDETTERKWCMMYNYRSNTCWHGLRQVRCDQDQIYITKCKRDEPRQQFSFVYLDDGYRKEEILIRLGSGHNSCFQRSGKTIVLRRCDPTSRLQRWSSPNDGDLHGYRFEISPRYVPGLCITQLHHPKEGERVELYSCKRSRSRYHQSSYWNVY